VPVPEHPMLPDPSALVEHALVTFFMIGRMSDGTFQLPIVV
jgi:hypothetical protein